MTERPLTIPVRITVLMPVYNAGPYLDAALDSILGQTCTDFELLVIDDGSTDDSVSRVALRNDPRIRLLRQPRNLGLVAALNRGLDEARGEYVARMDADDISLPKRLAKQSAFLNAHPEIGVCGTWMEGFSSEASALWRAPVAHEDICCHLLFESTLFHPTVMLRRELFNRHALRYDPDYPHAEDYEVWGRCALYFRLANLPEVLLRYRIHAASVGGRNRAGKLATARRVRARQLDKLGLLPTAEEQLLHECLARWEIPAEKAFLERTLVWLLKLQQANRDRQVYAEPRFSAMLAERWYCICERASPLGITAVRAWGSSPFRAQYGVPWSRTMRFMAKCLLRA